MNCDEYRKQRILAEREEALPPEARLHFAECLECQAYLREHERLRIEVRKLSEREHAPQALHESIAELLQQPAGGTPRRTRRWMTVAAAILILVGAGSAFTWYGHIRTVTPDRLAQEFMADHLHYLPGREQIVSQSPRQIEDWFQARVDFPVHVPEVPGTALEDARVCDIVGRKAALVHYRRKPDGTLISLFVSEPPTTLGRAKQPVALFKSYEGLNATLWSQRGLVYSLVASLDDASLEQVADSVRKQEP